VCIFIGGKDEIQNVTRIDSCPRALWTRSPKI